MRALASLQQPQEALVSRCVAGDEAAWAALYARYARAIAQFLKRLGVAPEALDDAVQEVFLQAFRSLDKFRGEAAIKTWLYRLAVTQARKVVVQPHQHLLHYVVHVRRRRHAACDVRT